MYIEIYRVMDCKNILFEIKFNSKNDNDNNFEKFVKNKEQKTLPFYIILRLFLSFSLTLIYDFLCFRFSFIF